MPKDVILLPAATELVLQWYKAEFPNIEAAWDLLDQALSIAEHPSIPGLLNPNADWELIVKKLRQARAQLHNVIIPF